VGAILRRFCIFKTRKKPETIEISDLYVN